MKKIVALLVALMMLCCAAFAEEVVAEEAAEAVASVELVVEGEIAIEDAMVEVELVDLPEELTFPVENAEVTEYVAVAITLPEGVEIPEEVELIITGNGLVAYAEDAKLVAVITLFDAEMNVVDQCTVDCVVVEGGLKLTLTKEVVVAIAEADFATIAVLEYAE